jgi:hypothetical protein
MEMSAPKPQRNIAAISWRAIKNDGRAAIVMVASERGCVGFDQLQHVRIKGL